MESGVHSSLHETCHHQILKFIIHLHINRKFGIIKRQTLKISKKQDVSFRGKSVLQIVKAIKNIVSNYIPHETITCNDRDPPWNNKIIKKLINDKNHAYTSYHQNENKPSAFQNFRFFQSK